MNIYQVSVNYVDEEDRLLLRINTREGEELKLWLTRRLSLSLTPMLGKAAAAQLQNPSALAPAHPAPAKPASDSLADKQRRRLLEQFQKEAISRDADYATPYQTQNPAAQTDIAPLLVTQVALTSLPSGQLEMNLSENLPGQNRQIELLMDAPLAQGLLHLLHKALKQSQWLESASQTTMQNNQDACLNAQVNADADEETDAASGVKGGKPRYLN